MRATLVILFLCCLASGLLTAQIDLKPKSVTADLISEQSTIAPGKEFRVAVKLEHQPTFHTYGKKLAADGTGRITVINWTLPQGWKAEELPWPATHETASTG